MRKVLLLIVAILSLFSSCNEGGIEGDAVRHLKSMMRVAIDNTHKVKLSNVRSTYTSDSLCILNFNLNYQKFSVPMEYIYVDIDIDGEENKLETITAVGSGRGVSGIMSEYMNGELSDEQKTELKDWIDDGYDVDYIATHSVYAVRTKYREHLIEDGSYKANDPDIEDKVLFSAAWAKLAVRGIYVEDFESQKRMNIDL